MMRSIITYEVYEMKPEQYGGYIIKFKRHYSGYIIAYSGGNLTTGRTKKEAFDEMKKLIREG